MVNVYEVKDGGTVSIQRTKFGVVERLNTWQGNEIPLKIKKKRLFGPSFSVNKTD
jgi:hypothetical protein